MTAPPGLQGPPPAQIPPRWRAISSSRRIRSLHRRVGREQLRQALPAGTGWRSSGGSAPRSGPPAAAAAPAVPAASLRSALARASGSSVSSAPDASAWYSRLRLIASWMIERRDRAEHDQQQHAERAAGPSSSSPPPPKNEREDRQVRQEHDRRWPARRPPTRSGCRGCRRGESSWPSTARISRGVEDLQDAVGEADGGVARVAAGRERVGLVGRAHVQPRHRLPGARSTARGRSRRSPGPRPR